MDGWMDRFPDAGAPSEITSGRLAVTLTLTLTFTLSVRAMCTHGHMDNF